MDKITVAVRTSIAHAIRRSKWLSRAAKALSAMEKQLDVIRSLAEDPAVYECVNMLYWEISTRSGLIVREAAKEAERAPTGGRYRKSMYSLAEAMEIKRLHRESEVRVMDPWGFIRGRMDPIEFSRKGPRIGITGGPYADAYRYKDPILADEMRTRVRDITMRVNNLLRVLKPAHRNMFAHSMCVAARLCIRAADAPIPSQFIGMDVL